MRKNQSIVYPPPRIPLSRTRLKKNLEKIMSEPYDVENFPHAAAITENDLYVLISWLKYIGAKNVLEFGCGTTTKLMSAEGFNVRTMSIGVSGDLAYNSVKFEDVDIYDIANLNEVLEAVRECDALVIDADHCYEAGEYYCDFIFSQVRPPVFMHDFYNPARRQHGEAAAVYEKAVNNTHSIFILTDIQDYTAIIGENRRTRGRNCAVILHPIEE